MHDAVMLVSNEGTIGCFMKYIEMAVRRQIPKIMFIMLAQVEKKNEGLFEQKAVYSRPVDITNRNKLLLKRGYLEKKTFLPEIALNK